MKPEPFGMTRILGAEELREIDEHAYRLDEQLHGETMRALRIHIPQLCGSHVLLSAQLAAAETGLARLRKRPTLEEVLARLGEHELKIDGVRAIWAEDAEAAVRALYAEKEKGT